MATVVATHDGPFHADDVFAVALIRAFHAENAQVVRTRDLQRIDEADLVVDVGGRYDPDTGRFDHHQASYTGPLSSAGMVLDWLRTSAQIDEGLARNLRSGIVDYIDQVDNGRTAPRGEVPCFPRIVEALNHPAGDHAAFDEAFSGAVAFAEIWVRGVAAGQAKRAEARRVVSKAMADAVAAGTRVIVLETYLPWKGAYFEAGGEDHPTDYVLHPGTDGSWRVVAIPPRMGEFGQKRSLPEAWAGLTDADLEAVTGVAGSVFCHKNRFIAVFSTRSAAEEALERHDLA